MKAVFIYLFFIVALLPAQEFREIERWEHDNPFFGQIMFSYVDDSGNLILDINNTRSRLINKNHSGQFLEVGEGPDELTGLLAIADFGPKQIALLERRDRIKIFTLVDGSYRFKEMKWLKRNEKPFFINAMLWEKDKIIMGGYETLETQKQLETAAYLKIYDVPENCYLNSLIESKKKVNNNFHMIKTKMLSNRDFVFLLKQDELKVHCVSKKDLSLAATVSLEKPGFYRAMPNDFFISKKKYQDDNEFFLDYDKWNRDFSSISNAAVHADKYLLVQIRTANAEMPNYALLFYDLQDGFRLVKTVLTDDLLLAGRDGKYYFYQGGDPGLDEVENLVIRVKELID